jgi:hypothetical protein
MSGDQERIGVDNSVLICGQNLAYPNFKLSKRLKEANSSLISTPGILCERTNPKIHLIHRCDISKAFQSFKLVL